MSELPEGVVIVLSAALELLATVEDDPFIDTHTREAAKTFRAAVEEHVEITQGGEQ